MVIPGDVTPLIPYEEVSNLKYAQDVMYIAMRE